ncbi:undecaprenyldiphospho-muramoylpentapeptide beta-N-acetylglucosaminyltransferase [Thermaurantiacus sp.]
MSGAILLAAGGTGGHLVPADALCTELMRRGHAITLVTDARGTRFPGLFNGVDTRVIPAATLSGANPLRWISSLATILRGRKEAARLIREKAVRAVVGFGGYPALPALLAGRSAHVPTLVHEQNAVLGRVNRFLGPRVSAVALSYRDTGRVPASARTRHVGNPVRAEVLEAREQPFHAPSPDQPFRLLVVGGSQGARILSDFVPAALAGLDDAHRRRLIVTHQARPEDLARADEAYRASGIRAECHAYMVDLPARMAAAHLLIARAGASTMAELTAMGRPAILIPFAAATDDHQAANARSFVEARAGFALREEEAQPHRLAALVEGFMDSPEALVASAAAARALGKPDAAQALADLVEAEMAAAPRAGA